MCDVGGCGNSAIGEEVAVLIPETGDRTLYLEVSLCARCGEELQRQHLIRDDEPGRLFAEALRVHRVGMVV